MTEEIICAIATPAGKGAIAVIRVSGAGSIALCGEFIRVHHGESLIETPGFKIRFGEFMDGSEILDEVLISIFRHPHSYTGEESVEISCHASSYIKQRILQILIDGGARLARAGEFTQRAFLNGKMDLSQAEAVADLIASSSAATHRMALKQMRGDFSTKLRRLRQDLLEITSLLELELDFSEEDVEFADREHLLSIANEISGLINRLVSSFSLGNVLKNGVPVAIVGNTNVGKSTLLNALLKDDRAIVSDIEGTTRDVIEDTINIDGITFRFIDTAGIRKTADIIETMGIERTFAKISEAKIVLLLLDGGVDLAGFSSYYKDIREHLTPEAELILLINKSDVNKDVDSLIESVGKQINGEPMLSISAKYGDNLESLISLLTQRIGVDRVNDDDIIVSNARHYEALLRAGKSVQRVIEGIQSDLSGEFISQDIRETLHYLGEITGEITTDEILGNIFQNFCIGK